MLFDELTRQQGYGDEDYGEDGVLYGGNPDSELQDAEDDYPMSPADERTDAAESALQLFEEILSSAGKVDWRSPEDLKLFEAKYRGKFQRVNETHGTLLHIFVTSRIKPKPLLFVKWFVKKWPELIKEVESSDKKTAIHLALDPRYHMLDFVEVVLTNFPNDDILATALGMPDSGRRNCLHHAIARKFASTLRLIDKCAPEAFTRHNSDGKTPLLMAMDHDCPLRRRVQPLRTQQSAAQNKIPVPQSVAKREQPDSTERPNGNEGSNLNIKDKWIVNADLESKNNPKEKEPASKVKEAPKPDEPAAKRTLGVQARFYLQDVVQSLMRKSTSSLSEVSRGQLSGQTPYQYRLYLLSKSNVTNAKEDIVAQDIKAFCLRNLRRDDAIKVLYERGKEKHIEFDLSSLPSSRISKGDLVQLARHLNFEDTLMYVALPKLHVEDSIQDSDHAHYDSNSLGDSLGRTDVNVIFQWLWDNGVRRIFKVIVIDDGNDGDVPHSNQAIEDALVQFKIETWDWKKIDICSNTIVLAAGEHVRVIYLYSSGNSAVLRSWSCEAGLVKLKLLEKVHLVIRRGLETEIRRNQDVEDFQTAFQENWKKLYPRKEIPEMTIIMDDKPKSYALGFRINKIPEQKQEWLSRMDMFASFISTIDLEKEKDKRNQERVQAGLDGASEDEKPKAIEDIKVAVIDDGIDGFGNDLSGSIAHGVSFCRSSDSENLIRTYYVSSGGHGTKMARLIRRICPTVKLYVARLEEYRSSGKRFITARSATEAVNWAVTNGVHIISMSWSIEGTEEQQDIKELKKAIEAAKRANITMFCAFSDQGTNSSEKTFPGYWASECMTIGAATAMGDASTLVDQNRVSFLFPGEQIVIDSKEPDPSSLSSPPKAENGSSISTALAAGTAALLLFITQLVNPQFFEKLREPARMKRAFKKFCPEANQKYFKAQDHFSKSFETDPSWTWEIEGKEKVTILVNNLMTQAEQQSDTYW